MSLVLAATYRVRDFEDWWRAIADLAPLTRLGAHHLVVYRSVEDENQVFVTIGLRDRHSVERSLASPDALAWLDRAGIDDIPPVFAGEVVEKLDLHLEADSFHGATPVIVAGIVRVPDFARYWDLVRSNPDGLKNSGISRYWAYRSIDDVDEVMFLEEVATEHQAKRWIRHPDSAAEWMVRAGIGEYPPLFIGTLVESISVPPSDVQR